MATQLGLYNGALIILGERILGSLSENRKPRRLLDAIWNDGFVDRLLELADWNHAINTIESTSDPSINPDFGKQHAHAKPDDWVRTIQVSLDDHFNMPYLSFRDENNYWWADSEVLYVRYTSSDAQYGGDLSLMPESLATYAELELARRANKSITQSNITQDELEAKAMQARNKASSIDAQNEPPQFAPIGSWVRSRGSRTNGNPRINRV